ncbi:MAG: glycosyltransferase family 39 protein [Anaerolineales bacterium]
MKKASRLISQSWLLPILLLALFLATRLPALGRFITTDEALWLRRSGNFYVAIANGDLAKTYQSPHPGVITMWAGAAGFQAVFPQYARAGFPEIHDIQLLQLMENRGVNPMEVLAAGRFALVLVHAAAFLAMWPYARRLLGPLAAALGLALLALDPFTIAHQRLLHLDGLLASFILLSLLAYLDFLRGGKVTSLVVSAIATGLAWLTKTPAWFLLPAIFGLTAFFLWRERNTKHGHRLSLWLAALIWLAVALLILLLLFPAMWTAPFDVLGQIFAYSLGSAEGEFSGPIYFNGAVYPDGNLGAAGWFFYPLTFLWRSTPLVLMGLLLAAFFFGRAFKTKKSNDKSIDRPNGQFAVPFLFLAALLFAIFMSVADKKFDRYLLPALPPLMLVAGWGWVRLAENIEWLRQQTWREIALLAVVAGLQLASALPAFPYYLSYYNPMVGAGADEVMMIGWGEGLDQAAFYLNKQPGLQPWDAAAWYSVSFNLMSNVEADDIPIALQLPPEQLEALLAKQYLVIYIHQWQRGTPQNLLDALAAIEPEFRVWINGLEYVRVYHLHGN